MAQWFLNDCPLINVMVAVRWVEDFLHKKWSWDRERVVARQGPHLTLGLSKSKWVGEPDNTYPAFKDKIILNLTALSWAGTPVHRCEWKVIALLLQNPKQINSWGVTELDPRSLWWLEWEDFISSLDLKAAPPSPLPPLPPPPPPPPLSPPCGSSSPELEQCLDWSIESLPPEMRMQMRTMLEARETKCHPN